MDDFEIRNRSADRGGRRLDRERAEYFRQFGASLTGRA